MDFYSEFKKLLLSKPHNTLSSRNIENCPFGDYLQRAKNVYLSYFMSDAEDCYYSEFLSKARDCMDCAYVSGAELCYECTDCSLLYDCSFLQDCHNCARCDFSFDLVNCKDCFGSFGLRNRQFCIFNKQYSEDHYREKVAALKTQPPHKIMAIMEPEFDKHPRLFARQIKGGEHSLGDYIYFSKNCYACFNIRNMENAAYVIDSMEMDEKSADCFDCTYIAGSELCYECENVSQCSNCNFLEDCVGCSDSEYLSYCYNCKNCFGCAYLSNKEYCILNRQFTRDEYLVALKKIKGDLQAAGSYGKCLADILL